MRSIQRVRDVTLPFACEVISQGTADKFGHCLRVLSISVLALGLFQAPSAASSIFFIDQFSVDLNGTNIFTDGFGDGSAPPSAPTAIGGVITNVYNTNVAIPAGSEANGTLALSPAYGEPTTTANGKPALLENVLLLTPQNPANPTVGQFALASNDTFKVAAVYNYVNPNGPSEQYRLSVTDRVQPPGPGDTTNDVIRIVVARPEFNGAQAAAINPATGQPFGNLNGQVIVGMYKADFVANTVTWVEAYAVNLTGNPDQIRLELTKSNAASTSISASFIYMKGGSDLTTTSFATAIDAFHGENFTRSEFSAFQRTDVNTLSAAKLTTGSPASISQNVSQISSSNLQFQYRFATTSGQLRVTLNGVDLGLINAPVSLVSSFTTVNFDTSLYVGLVNALLTFTLDGPTGSSILLDNILFGNLTNGDFQTGNLTGWTAVASGAGSVGVQITVEETPLPAALPLFASGAGVIVLLARRRKRRSAAS